MNVAKLLETVSRDVRSALRVLGRVLAGQLPAVETFDLGVVAATVAALGGGALVASRLPARKAARVEPLVPLQRE
jgi:ABC-type lipoprotein release transport system permease subunit